MWREPSSYEVSGLPLHHVQEEHYVLCKWLFSERLAGDVSLFVVCEEDGKYPTKRLTMVLVVSIYLVVNKFNQKF